MDDQSLNLPEEQVGEFTDNTAPQPSASGGYEANEVSYEEPTSLEGTPAEETFSDSATPESFEATPSSENMTSDISESTEVPTEGSSPADSMPDAISYDTPQEMAYEANEDLSGPEAYETTPQEQTANEVMPDMSSATDSETPEVSDATPPITEQQPSQMEDPDDVLTEFGMEYPQETDVEETAPAAEVMAASPNSGAGTPSSPLVAPANGQNNNVKIIVLVLLTIVLLGVLAGTIWYFFLRDTGGEGPSTTPTPTQIPQPTSSQDTHLECRFGLCVEVPGPGDNLCASSFDCEQALLTPTQEPTPTSGAAVTPEVSVTLAPTETPTATVTAAPTPTTVIPTAIPTTQPTVVPTNTPTPTPLADSLPTSGTTENTLVLAMFFVLSMGAGVFVLRRNQA